jgi:penicillin-binding protein-related factor A (putative recombinase)
MQAAGRPDIEGCYKGRYVGFEVKTPENSGGVTSLQAHTLKVIARAGGVSGVITSPEEALELLPI